MARRPAQLDLFFSADLLDVPIKGQRETLSLPLFSLSKSRKSRQQYVSAKDTVDISAPSHIGIATIWDFDVLLWVASQLIAARERRKEVSPRLKLTAYELLKSTGRGTSGTQYKLLREALSRLTATTVKTNVRVPDGKQTTMFSWLESWREETDARGRSQWLELTLSSWFFDAVMSGTVLTMSPDYFKLTGGLERWLYGLVRKHAGNQVTGWVFGMKELHRKSGSSRALKYFARDLRKIVAADALPEYHLDAVELQGGPGVHAVRRSLLATSHPAYEAGLAMRHRKFPKVN